MKEEGETSLSQTPARRPTFLAHYPRRLKLFVTALVFVPLVYVGVSAGIEFSQHAKNEEPDPFAQLDAEHQEASETAEAGDPLQTDGAEGGAADAAGGEQQADKTAAPGLDPNNPASGAIAQNDLDDRDARMPPAPDPNLADVRKDGTLPIMSPEGHKPWQVYARPFNATDPRPRIALIVTDMGLSNVATMSALERLPSPVTLAVDAQSPLAGAWLGRARQMGHETLLAVPMEPLDYPRSDPGANTMLSRLSDSNNLDRLFRSMKQGVGYVGIAFVSGTRLVSETDKLSIVMDSLKERGLLAFDATLASNSVASDLAHTKKVPFAVAARRVDESPTSADIDAALAQLEQTARLTGKAVAVISPLPLTLDRVEPWIKKLAAHHIVLAPVSAIVD